MIAAVPVWRNRGQSNRIIDAAVGVDDEVGVKDEAGIGVCFGADVNNRVGVSEGIACVFTEIVESALVELRSTVAPGAREQDNTSNMVKTTISRMKYRFICRYPYGTPVRLHMADIPITPQKVFCWLTDKTTKYQLTPSSTYHFLYETMAFGPTEAL
jgi:hypothetical protein